MKRIVSSILVCVLLVGCVLALASCGGPSGTYKDKSGVTTLTFKGSQVTIALGDWSTVANFKIEGKDDDRTITFSYSEGQEKSTSFDGTFDYSEGTEDGVDYIRIGFFAFEKTE